MSLEKFSLLFAALIIVTLLGEFRFKVFSLAYL